VTFRSLVTYVGTKTNSQTLIIIKEAVSEIATEKIIFLAILSASNQQIKSTKNIGIFERFKSTNQINKKYWQFLHASYQKTKSN
jgi:hypothetical protein